MAPGWLGAAGARCHAAAMVDTILRRTVFITLAIALIAGLAAPGAGAASAPGRRG